MRALLSDACKRTWKMALVPQGTSCAVPERTLGTGTEPAPTTDDGFSGTPTSPRRAANRVAGRRRREAQHQCPEAVVSQCEVPVYADDTIESLAALDASRRGRTLEGMRSIHRSIRPGVRPGVGVSGAGCRGNASSFIVCSQNACRQSVCSQNNCNCNDVDARGRRPLLFTN